MFKDTEYKIDIKYEIKDSEADVEYLIKFASALPETGRLIVRLTGTMRESTILHFNSKTKSVESDPNTFKFTDIDIGDVSLRVFLNVLEDPVFGTWYYLIFLNFF
jgi:hypothetical protein